MYTLNDSGYSNSIMNAYILVIKILRDEFLGTSKAACSHYMCAHMYSNSSNNNKPENIEFVQEQQNVRRRKKKAEAVFGKRAKFSKSNHDLGHLVKNCTIFSALHFCSVYIFFYFISVNFAMCKKLRHNTKYKCFFWLWMEVN